MNIKITQNIQDTYTYTVCVCMDILHKEILMQNLRKFCIRISVSDSHISLYLPIGDLHYADKLFISCY